jgi:hypothetical protein
MLAMRASVWARVKVPRPRAPWPAKETFCRVRGYDDHLDERYFVGEPQYIFCDCCGSEPGPDDLYPNLVRRPGSGGSKPAGCGPMSWTGRPTGTPDAALVALPAKWRDL